MLQDADVIAFIPSQDLERSRRFYQLTLGLQFISEDPFALIFNANGVMLRIANVSNTVDFRAAPYTILGWRVPNAEATVHMLVAKSMDVLRFPGMQQDDRGIWHSPAGAKVAWFKDPDGNILSITEM